VGSQVGSGDCGSATEWLVYASECVRGLAGWLAGWLALSLLIYYAWQSVRCSGAVLVGASSSCPSLDVQRHVTSSSVVRQPPIPCRIYVCARHTGSQVQWWDG
jgi:hypothetical protein